MLSRSLPSVLAVVLGSLAVLPGATPAGGQGVESVSVVNFPPVQEVAGDVGVRTPVRLASSFVRRKVTVLPGRALQVRDLTTAASCAPRASRAPS